MNAPLKLPFYVKASLFLLGLYVFISMLYMAQEVIVPLIYATLFAILISPVINFLEKKRINRVVAIASVLLVALTVAGTLIGLLASQASRFSDAWPQLMNKLHEVLSQSVTFISGHFNISADKINEFISGTKADVLVKTRAAIGSTITTAGTIFAAAVLVPVYIFMILFYQPHLLGFIHKLFGAANDSNVSEVLAETKTIVRGYLVGLFLEFVIISVLNSVGLLVLRIDYAILLGIIGALLNVIPIIGGIICVGLFVIIALLTKSPVYILYVVVLYALIQFIDDHWIFPKIVGSKVKLNVLISIVAVIAVGALWGIPGMFLAIPMMAIIKLILDHIESLKAWGFLLGDAVPTGGKMKFGFTIKGFIRGFKSKKL